MKRKGVLALSCGSALLPRQQGSRRALLCAVMAWLVAMPASAENTFITLLTTTSTHNSGLLDDLLPRFTAQEHIGVRPVVAGTGQVLEKARRGDGDVVIVHARAQEELFVAQGYGTQRWDLMVNDFLLIGPRDDPAGLAGAESIQQALVRLARAGASGQAIFLSRGDQSGTHVREMALWRAAGLDLSPTPPWYRETGAGMGATINIAQNLPAYTLADRGTWLAFHNRDNLTVHRQGDPQLVNPYSVIPVNPQRHPHVKFDLVSTFVRWLLSAQGQQAIRDYAPHGQPLFFPNAIHAHMTPKIAM